MVPSIDPSVKQSDIALKKSKLDNPADSDTDETQLTEKLNKKWQKQLASAQKAEFEYTKNTVPTISLRHSQQVHVSSFI